ncbi:MAG: antibiotic biosynthesis monooxygenase [Chitinophagales bacterium]|nr:antibiotic biosynthesis monooxygenase [Chitinophagales bacterium]
MKKSTFVAINYISCSPDYRERFEYLFSTRAHAIDRMPGFIDMMVLKPQKDDEAYLVLSRWESEAHFKAWTNSPEFMEGHRRGFEDIRKAKEEGKPSPLTSDFKTYEIITE